MPIPFLSVLGILRYLEFSLLKDNSAIELESGVGRPILSTTCLHVEAQELQAGLF